MCCECLIIVSSKCYNYNRHWTPRYTWNTVKFGFKHQSINNRHRDDYKNRAPGLTPVFGGVRVAHHFSFLCCVVFLCFVCLRLCLVCPMLPVSLDCPLLFAPSVFSDILFVLGYPHKILCTRKSPMNSCNNVLSGPIAVLFCNKIILN